jgi:hypothetical protein
MEDRVFRAIANLRHRGRVEEFVRLADARPKHDYSDADEDTQRRSKLLEETINSTRSGLTNASNPADEKLLAQVFVDAVKRGDISRLKDLASMCKLYEDKMISPPKERRSDVKSWYYYAGMAALRFLRKEVVPTKKQVKEQTLVECALAEFPMNVPIADWGNQIDKKIDQMRALFPSERNLVANPRRSWLTRFAGVVYSLSDSRSIANLLATLVPRDTRRPIVCRVSTTNVSDCALACALV